MKKIFVALTVVVALAISCGGGAKQETVNKMADELCEAMQLYDESNPMSSIEVLSALTKIKENEEEYGEVTEAQLIEAMELKCPEGLKIYKKMSGGSN